MSADPRIRLLAVALGLGAAAAGTAYYQLFRRPLPDSKKDVRLRGLGDPVEVCWDSWGVPHVRASSAADAFLVQGYLHARDRLWQMDLNRRIGSGRLSEIFGERTLEMDRFLRRVGLHRAARAELEDLGDQGMAVLSAYCRGVNAFLARATALPLEFQVLRYRPDPWRPEDTLTWAKTMGWSLSLNWDTELFRARFIARIGPEAAAKLEQDYPPGHPLTVPPGAAEQYAGHDGGYPAAAYVSHLEGGFSNAWVVSGSRSGTGRPLLANDPHLVPQLPSPWYEVHLECPDFRAAGASLPGAPGIVVGHNERIAWGITASMVDTQDAYVEELSGEDPARYRVPGGWQDGFRIAETIRVKGRRTPVVEQVLITRHGPVIIPAGAGGSRAIALRSTLLERGGLLRAALELLTARDWAGFRGALASWDAPSVNFVYADVEGNIGYQLAGRVPRRRLDSGLVPAAGWEDGHEWDGYLGQDEVPWAYNPPAGYVVNANNKPASGEPYIGGEWIDGYRAGRIQEMILASPPLGRIDVRGMQMDSRSLAALELMRRLGGFKPGTERAAEAFDVLRRWDGSVSAESPGAAVYEAFRLRLLRNLLAPVLGDLLDDYFGMALHPLAVSSAYQYRGASFLLALLDGMREDSGADGWNAVIEASLEEAAADLRGRLGPAASRYRWGRLHRASFPHALGSIPVLGRLLTRGPYPVRGDSDTVHQASYSLRHPYEASRWLPTLRFVADTADWDRSLMVHAPGQSGQPGSRHYDDLIPYWRRGAYHPMPFTSAAVDAAAVARQSFFPSEPAKNPRP